MAYEQILKDAGLSGDTLRGGTLAVTTPIDGSEIARVHQHTAADMNAMINAANEAFGRGARCRPRAGRAGPPLGEELRADKEQLGALVTLECGKILQEGLGEVQEMIDICDFAVGLSRQLYGLTIASERPGHAMRETWHPDGRVRRRSPRSTSRSRVWAGTPRWRWCAATR